MPCSYFCNEQRQVWYTLSWMHAYTEAELACMPHGQSYSQTTINAGDRYL